MTLLTRLTVAVRAEWPELKEVTDAELHAFIHQRVPPEKIDPDVRVGDLLLACACVRGIRTAHDLLEEMTAEDIERVYNRIRPPITLTRAKQLIFSRLFTIPEGGVARIALYRGDEELIGHVRNAASRELLNLAHKTKQRPEFLEDNILQAENPKKLWLPADPDLDRVKRNYLPGLRLAITHAFSSLDSRERALLRYAIIEQMTMEQLALLYAQTETSMADWIRAAKEKLEFRVKHRLAERLRVSDKDHNTLIRFVGSQLDILLAPILAS